MAFPMEGNLRRVVVGDDDDDMMDAHSPKLSCTWRTEACFGCLWAVFFFFLFFTGNAGCRGW
jgi:hypothetical protein